MHWGRNTTPYAVPLAAACAAALLAGCGGGTPSPAPISSISTVPTPGAAVTASPTPTAPTPSAVRSIPASFTNLCDSIPAAEVARALARPPLTASTTHKSAVQPPAGEVCTYDEPVATGGTKPLLAVRLGALKPQPGGLAGAHMSLFGHTTQPLPDLGPEAYFGGFPQGAYFLLDGRAVSVTKARAKGNTLTKEQINAAARIVATRVPAAPVAPAGVTLSACDYLEAAAVRAMGEPLLTRRDCADATSVDCGFASATTSALVSATTDATAIENLKQFPPLGKPVPGLPASDYGDGSGGALVDGTLYATVTLFPTWSEADTIALLKAAATGLRP